MYGEVLAKTYIDKILKLQKCALRTISNSHYRAHTDPLFVKYNVLNVYDMYKLDTGVFMYISFQNYHTKYKDHYHQTRNARTFSDHSIITYGPILWNSLDYNIRKSNSIKHFKNQNKTKLMCLGVHCIYYVNL